MMYIPGIKDISSSTFFQKSTLHLVKPIKKKGPRLLTRSTPLPRNLPNESPIRQVLKPTSPPPMPVTTGDEAASWGQLTSTGRDNYADHESRTFTENQCRLLRGDIIILILGDIIIILILISVL